MNFLDGPPVVPRGSDTLTVHGVDIYRLATVAFNIFAKSSHTTGERA